MLFSKPEKVKDRITMIKGGLYPERFWSVVYVDENLVDYFISEGFYKYNYGKDIKKS